MFLYSNPFKSPFAAAAAVYIFVFFFKEKVYICVSGELGVSLHELKVTSKNDVPRVISGHFLGGGAPVKFLLNGFVSV